MSRKRSPRWLAVTAAAVAAMTVVGATQAVAAVSAAGGLEQLPDPCDALDTVTSSAERLQSGLVDLSCEPAPDDAPEAPDQSGTDRPYFQAADWLWNPVPDAPELDPQSAAMVEHLATGDHIANTGDFGVTLRGGDDITEDTPRFPISFSQEGSWGPDPFAGETVPIPDGTPIAPGSDGHLAVADPTTNTVYNMWMAQDSGSDWSAGWGAMTPLDGDGREENGSSTGAGIARYAAVVRAEEIAAGEIPHALFFSTNVAAPDEVRYPATKTDGSNMDGVDTPIPEGARVQLDPDLDLDSLGLSEGELTVARALQTYGAYVGDNGGARMAFLFEYAPESSAYSDAGIEGDYAPLDGIPWDRLQVLADWNGGQGDTPTDPGRTGDDQTGDDQDRSDQGGDDSDAPRTPAPDDSDNPDSDNPDTDSPDTDSPDTDSPDTDSSDAQPTPTDEPNDRTPSDGTPSDRAPSSGTPAPSAEPSRNPEPGRDEPSGDEPSRDEPSRDEPAGREPARAVSALTGLPEAAPRTDIGEPTGSASGTVLAVGDGGEYSSIQEAVDAAGPGDTVEVAAGRYDGFSMSTAGTADAWITVRAADGAAVVVEGGGDGQGLVDLNGASYVRLEGISVVGSGSHGVYGAGVDHVVLRDCEVADSSDGGIVLLDGTDVLIEGCEVHGNNARGTSASNEAISIVNIDGFEVLNSYVHDNGEEGIDAKYEARNGVIHHNAASGNRGPNIYVDSARDIEVSDNLVTGATEASKSGIGLAVEDFSETRNLSGILVRDNVINDNAGAGVDFWMESSGTISDVRIEDNAFSGNGRGSITVNAADISGDNVISGNVFSGGDEPPNGLSGFTLSDNAVSEALEDVVESVGGAVRGALRR